MVQAPSSVDAPSSETPQPAVNSKEFKAVDVHRLKVGTTLNFPIFDDRDVLLRAPGAPITEVFLKRLIARGISTVKLHQSELARMQAFQPTGTATSTVSNRRSTYCQVETEHSSFLDQQLATEDMNLPPQGEAFSHQLKQHDATAYDKQTMEAMRVKHQQSVDQVQMALDSMTAGKGLDLDSMSAISSDALLQMAEDSDVFTCMGINPYSENYPARHSMHVSMLAMAIGVTLGLDKPTLKELGIGCLVHDAGMMKINPIFESPEILNEIEFLEITKHPIKVFDMMLDMQQVPRRSAFIGYQMHERCDGSGYPRNREAAQIHYLCKVAAVADAFVGLVSNRPHRRGLLPYLAIDKLVNDARASLYDKSAVQALLKTVSLFPIGSFIELSDGRVARVIRTNPTLYHRPVIEAFRKGELDAPPEVVDLAKSSELVVLRPLARLDSADG